MFEKIKKSPADSIIKTLSDTRSLGLIVFGIIALLVTWSGVKVVQTNYDLQKHIATMQQQNDIKRLENSNLALKNQYLQTDQYLELAARRQYNKALSGEKLLIVPKSVALARTVDVKLPEEHKVKADTAEDEGAWYERNFNAWQDFLFKN